ncbi:MAG: T9SS type A sorting domain-containing protein [Flavobacteriaceae bacterium]
MKTKLLAIAVALLSLPARAQQTMTFSSGATEPGFTFSGWNSDNANTIWLANATVDYTATCTVDSGTWDFISFDVGPFLGNLTYEVTSNLNDSYSYSGNTAQTHTLNWMGITSVTFKITAAQFQTFSADHDNFVYRINTLGMENEKVQQTITVYPNPVMEGVLYISNIEENSNLRIEFYNILGKLVKTARETQIDVSKLPPGVYLLKIRTDNAWITQKLIRK